MGGRGVKGASRGDRHERTGRGLGGCAQWAGAWPWHFPPTCASSSGLGSTLTAQSPYTSTWKKKGGVGGWVGLVAVDGESVRGSTTVWLGWATSRQADIPMPAPAALRVARARRLPGALARQPGTAGGRHGGSCSNGCL